MSKLTDLRVRKAKAGLHGDGSGLWLMCSKAGNKRWAYRYMMDGRAREMGLGAFPTTSLAEARELRDAALKLVKAGIDPIDKRRGEKTETTRMRQHTFASVTEACIERKSPGWRSAGSAREWRASLTTHVFPVIGNLPVASIERRHIEQVLLPIWHTKSGIAPRIRSRIESILDFATVQGLRTGDNPARWKGHLEHILAAQQRQDRHHAALPWQEVGAFLERLRLDPSNAARMVEFIILCACRSGEARLACFNEIDFREKIWTIAASRTKAGKLHRVPLSDAAMAVIEPLAEGRRSDADFIFANGRKPFSPLASYHLMHRIGFDVTLHGFRSTFRDWVSETTSHEPHVAEMALGHAVGNAVEAAYRRGDLFEKRRRLMEDWSDFCTGKSARKGEVVALRLSR